MEKIFISHSSIDKPFVSELANFLRQDGFPVWFDTWDIKSGDSIVRKIEEGLTDSGCLLVVLSKNSVESNWLKEEIDAFLFELISKKKGKLILIRKEDCTPSLFIRKRKYIDFSDSFEKGYWELCIDLCYKGFVPVEILGEFNKMYDGNTSYEKVDKNLFSHFIQNKKFKDVTKNNFIITDEKNYIEIEEDGTVSHRSELLYLNARNEIKNEVLFDRIYCSYENPEFSSTKYKTNSKILDVEYLQDGSFQVNWKPNKEIDIGEIYKHTFSWSYEKSFIDSSDFWAYFNRDFVTLKTRMSFECKRKDIEKILVFRSPISFEIKDDWEIISYGLNYPKTISYNKENASLIDYSLNWPENTKIIFTLFLFQDWEKDLNKRLSQIPETQKVLFKKNCKVEWHLGDQFEG